MIEKEAEKVEADCTSCAEKHGQTHPIHNRQVLLTKFEIFTSICVLSEAAACGQEELVIYSN